MSNPIALCIATNASREFVRSARPDAPVVPDRSRLRNPVPGGRDTAGVLRPAVVRSGGAALLRRLALGVQRLSDRLEPGGVAERRPV